MDDQRTPNAQREPRKLSADCRPGILGEQRPSTDPQQWLEQTLQQCHGIRLGRRWRRWEHFWREMIRARERNDVREIERLLIEQMDLLELILADEQQVRGLPGV